MEVSSDEATREKKTRLMIPKTKKNKTTIRFIVSPWILCRSEALWVSDQTIVSKDQDIVRSIVEVESDERVIGK